MTARSVVVVMPFGGKDPVERRRAILNFKRLDYLVRNKCKVTSSAGANDNGNVAYAVQVVRTAMDEIPEKALQQIEAADILIALFLETNPNVIYEVSQRMAHNQPLILVVDEDKDNLPLYLKNVAYQPWKQEEVLKRIEKIATDDLPDLPNFTVGIPEDLRQIIDKEDSELQKGLEEALQEIEATFKPHRNEAVECLYGIASDKISNFYPCSIVEVGFSRRNEFANDRDPAIVLDFDDEFSRLYGYVDKKQAEADKPLTLTKLLNRIMEFCDGSDWDEFMKEQTQLSATVIKEYGFARATVPIRIDEKHPRKEFRGQSYLPCIVGQVIDYNSQEDRLDGPHKMYLLVVYIEIADLVRK